MNTWFAHLADTLAHLGHSTVGKALAIPVSMATMDGIDTIMVGIISAQSSSHSAALQRKLRDSSRSPAAAPSRTRRSRRNFVHSWSDRARSSQTSFMGPPRARVQKRHQALSKHNSQSCQHTESVRTIIRALFFYLGQSHPLIVRDLATEDLHMSALLSW